MGPPGAQFAVEIGTTSAATVASIMVALAAPRPICPRENDMVYMKVAARRWQKQGRLRWGPSPGQSS